MPNPLGGLNDNFQVSLRHDPSGFFTSTSEVMPLSLCSSTFENLTELCWCVVGLSSLRKRQIFSRGASNMPSSDTCTIFHQPKTVVSRDLSAPSRCMTPIEHWVFCYGWLHLLMMTFRSVKKSMDSICPCKTPKNESLIPPNGKYPTGAATPTFMPI